MRKLIITRVAEADLLEIWIYLFEHSPQTADRVMDEITAQYDHLLEFPFMGRQRLEFGGDYRSLPVGNYVIFYRVKDDLLEISRVLHGSRDLTGIFTLDVEEGEA
jgi:toxin ParE1/3/4